MEFSPFGRSPEVRFIDSSATQVRTHDDDDNETETIALLGLVAHICPYYTDHTSTVIYP